MAGPNTKSSTANAAGSDSEERIIIGNANPDGSSMDVDVSDFRVYNRAISSAEVT